MPGQDKFNSINIDKNEAYIRKSAQKFFEPQPISPFDLIRQSVQER